jgi:gamma-glutamyltranspeptidase / glutathione hydrolase
MASIPLVLAIFIGPMSNTVAGNAKMRLQRRFFLSVIWFVALAQTALTFGQEAASKQNLAKSTEGMVATVQPLATDIGAKVLREGGNAVDAAIASALVLGVVDGHNSGIGGGCFILIRTADGKILVIDGRETAPAKSTRDMFLKDGKPQPIWSQTGPLASGVPGALAAYQMALEKAGTRKLAELVAPARDLADKGFEISRSLTSALNAEKKDLCAFEGAKEVLVRGDGRDWQLGDRLNQKDLAGTLAGVAENGLDHFYRGPVAEKIGAWMTANGGLLTKEDFAAYRPILREPIRTKYRNWQIIGFPPPSSGGVHVAQILKLVEPYDLRQLHAKNPVDFVHLTGDAMKLAFADRVHWLGDPDFAKVPTGLLNNDYLESRRKLMSMDHAANVDSHGQPPDWDSRWFGKHTTHLCSVDKLGNWVGITQTVNTSFGSKVIVPGTGVVLNNEMDDFAIAPNTPNAFGLLGSEANSVAPGKRPLSSMSPTIVLENGEPILVIGAAGGPTIITQTASVILRYLDLEMPLDEAMTAPRFHHQWRPDRLLVERAASKSLADELKTRGHAIESARGIATVQAIGRRAGEKELHGVGEPRTASKAAGP